MIRAVLDTNVVISAIFWKGAPHQIVQKGISGAFSIITSEEILEEVRGKLTEKFKFPPSSTAEILEVMILNSEIVCPIERLHVVKEDPTDNKIIECAVTGNADYIITGDRHLLKLEYYQTAQIIKPTDFLEII